MNTECHKVKLLKQRGWYAWYNPHYWVHYGLANPVTDDYTKCGMSLEKAFELELSRTKWHVKRGVYKLK